MLARMHALRILAAALLFATSALARTPELGEARTTVLQLPEIHARISIGMEPAVRNGAEVFRTLRFVVRGRSLKITAREELTPFGRSQPNGGLYPGMPVKGLSVHPGNFFFVGRYGTPDRPHTVLVFEGDSATSSAAPVLVVGFHEDGTPYKLLELHQFDPLAFTPRSEGTALLTGAPSLTEVMGGEYDGHRPYATTYDPSAVYEIKPDLPAAYSLEASRAYNTEHYVWAGPHWSDRIAVIVDPAHPHTFRAVPAAKLDQELKRLH